MDHPADLDKITRERDLYLRLLDLGHQEEVEPFLQEALRLIVEVTGARQGYIELYDESDRQGRPRWSIGHGLSADEIAGIRTTVSGGIIAEALATGETILTASALLDERFSSRNSVRLGRIEAVLCAPIGVDPPRGVLYLEGAAGPQVFGEEQRRCAETFARHLAPLARRLLNERQHLLNADPTKALRDTLRLGKIVGRSPALAAVLRQVALVAPLDVTVLLTGESGTGKSQLARVIHDNGPRANHPFVEVNCGALPDTLIESELFGALAGAHSTAARRIEGKVEAAERGTLFLDEIGALSLAAQAKLLQLLQSKQYYPLGSARPVHADVRVIAATNTELEAAVAERQFREDLFYRLQVLPVRMPSLAERREDIPDLATSFCSDACSRYGVARLELSFNAVRAVEAAPWPGNVRQLEHAIEAAVIRAAAEHATQIERAHIFPSTATPAGDEAPLTFQEATRRFQRTLVSDALLATGWNVLDTAQRLDLTRAHVYNLIRAFGLQRERNGTSE